MPVGTKSGFGSLDPALMLPTSQRQILCNFLGNFNGHRGAAIETMKRRGLKCHVQLKKGFGASGVKVIDYRNLLRESRFTLTPWGANYETFRFYEALEAGSIPIFQRLPQQWDHKRSPFNALGPDCPIPQFESWDKAADFILELQKKSDNELDQLQKTIVDFWMNFKLKTQQDIRETIDASFRKAHKCDSC